MSGVLKIEIKETLEELNQLLKSKSNQQVKERIQVLYWIKSQQAKTTMDLASLLGKHRTTVSRWLSSYRQQGIKGILNKGKSSGRKRKLNPEIESSLKQELKDPEGFSSYKEIQKWLQVIHDVEMSYTGVHKLVRYKLGAKLKVPRPTHVKQKSGALEGFKKNWVRTSNSF